MRREERNPSRDPAQSVLPLVPLHSGKGGDEKRNLLGTSWAEQCCIKHAFRKAQANYCRSIPQVQAVGMFPKSLEYPPANQRNSPEL
jgi:hypothetical protein